MVADITLNIRVIIPTHCYINVTIRLPVNSAAAHLRSYLKQTGCTCLVSNERAMSHFMTALIKLPIGSPFALIFHVAVQAHIPDHGDLSAVGE